MYILKIIGKCVNRQCYFMRGLICDRIKDMNRINILKSIIVIAVFVIFPGAASADQYYDNDIFFTDAKYAADSRTSVSATLRSISSKAYFYIEDDYWRSMTDANKQADYIKTLDKLGAEFDNNIYPNLTEFYGKPWEPGIDNDLRITFLLSPLKDSFGGYFSSKDEYPIKDMPTSNEREMVYINAPDINNKDFNILKTFIAHEFTHLIIFYQKEKTRNISEDVWFHESRAEYSSAVLGYNNPYTGSVLENRVNNFIANFSDPLGEWKNQTADYGMVAIFAQYLRDNYVIGNILVDTLKNNKSGIDSINEILGANDYSERFDDIFLNFAIANNINDRTIENNKYGYANENLKTIKLPIHATVSLGSGSKITQAISLKDWSFKYYKFEGLAKMAKITFSKASTNDVFGVAIIMENSNNTKTIRKIDLNQNETELYLSGLGSSVRSFVVVPVATNKISNFTDNDASYRLDLTVESVNYVTPVIVGLSSGYGFSEGGETAKIYGNNFDPGARVFFGDIEAKIISMSPNVAEVIIPDHNPGDVSVAVTDPSGVKSGGVNFRYFKRQDDGSLIRASGDSRIFITKGSYRRHIKDAKIFSFYGHLGFDKVKDVSWQELGLYKESDLIKSEHSPKVYSIENTTKHWLNISADQFVSSGRNWDAIYFINKKEFDLYKSGSEINL